MLSQVQTVCGPSSGSFQNEKLREAAQHPKLHGPASPLLCRTHQTPEFPFPLSFVLVLGTVSRLPCLLPRDLPENPSSLNPPGPSPPHLKYLPDTTASWKLPYHKVTPLLGSPSHLGRFSAVMRTSQHLSHLPGGKCSVWFLFCNQPGFGAC